MCLKLRKGNANLTLNKSNVSLSVRKQYNINIDNVNIYNINQTNI